MSIEVFRPEPTLDQLAATINTEYRLANEAAWDAIRHAVDCGEALLEAQRRVPGGTWLKWVSDNVNMERTLRERYMRLATHRDLVLAPGAPGTIIGAVNYLQAIGAHDRRRENGWGSSKLDVSLVRKLKAQGLTNQEIAVATGFSWHTVAATLDPNYRKKRLVEMNRRNARRREERKALAARERDEAVKRHGGTPAEAYALLRRCALVADRAITESDEAEYRVSMQTALAYIHKAEDQIVKALRIGRQT